MNSYEIGKVIVSLIDGGTTRLKPHPEYAISDVSEGVGEQYIVYSITGMTPTNVKDKDSRVDEVDFDIRIFGIRLTNVVSLAASVRADLDRFKGKQSGVVVDRITFVDQNHDYDHDTRRYMIEQTYTARVKDG